jgi:glutathione S-transferase
MTRKLYSLAGADISRPFSPHVWKIVMALAHKGLDFEEIPTAFTDIPKIEGGETKIVPYLIDGERRIGDSFAIARYLEEAYPDRPSLFGGGGGLAAARFVEGFAQTTIHPALTRMIVLDIHNLLAPADQTYFRQTREARLGKSLEDVVADRQQQLQAFPQKLEPIRHMLKFQPFIGGDTPLFADYIIFGAFQWARITSKTLFLLAGDPVADWFERCLDLHGGVGRSVTSA